jgi:SAM-dependent methyltransferase
MTAAAAEIKACCAAAYGSEAVRWLLGDRLHPGGAALTGRLIDALAAGPAALVADVACGPGASALQAATQTGCQVVGVDLSPACIERASAAALAAGLDGRVRFVVGDAERLPLADSSVAGVLCECALCTFPDKAAAAREIARVLRPGGKLALSDMTADSDRLPHALRSLDGWIACVSDARALGEIAALLADAGLEVIVSERHDEALHAMVDRADGRLRLARALGAGQPPELADSMRRALTVVSAAREAIADEALGYGTVIARKSRGS